MADLLDLIGPKFRTYAASHQIGGIGRWRSSDDSSNRSRFPGNKLPRNTKIRQ